MIVGYARVSTDSQSIAPQIKKLVDVGIPSNLIFTDEGVSGLKEPGKRTGYKELMNILETGEVTDLYISELSRLGRDTKSTFEELIRLERMGIKVHSLSPTEAVLEDIANPALKPLLISIFQLSADLERQHISDRTKAGLVIAKLKGKKCGRPEVDIDLTKIKHWTDKGLSERAAIKVCGYSYSTFYRRKEKIKEMQAVRSHFKQ